MLHTNKTKKAIFRRLFDINLAEEWELKIQYTNTLSIKKLISKFQKPIMVKENCPVQPLVSFGVTCSNNLGVVSMV